MKPQVWALSLDIIMPGIKFPIHSFPYKTDDVISELAIELLKLHVIDRNAAYSTHSPRRL